MRNVNTLDLLSIDAFAKMDSPEMERNVNVSTNTDFLLVSMSEKIIIRRLTEIT